MSKAQLSRRRIKLQKSDPEDIVADDVPGDDQMMEEDRVAEMNDDSDSEKGHASGEESEDEAEEPKIAEEECDSDVDCDDKDPEGSEEIEECEDMTKDDSDMDMDNEDLDG